MASVPCSHRQNHAARMPHRSRPLPSGPTRIKSSHSANTKSIFATQTDTAYWFFVAQHECLVRLLSRCAPLWSPATGRTIWVQPAPNLAHTSKHASASQLRPIYRTVKSASFFSLFFPFFFSAVIASLLQVIIDQTGEYGINEHILAFRDAVHGQDHTG